MGGRLPGNDGASESTLEVQLGYACFSLRTPRCEENQKRPCGRGARRRHLWYESVHFWQLHCRLRVYLAGFIQTAIKLFDRQYGSDDESERVAAPRTPTDGGNYGGNDGNYGGESRLEQALMSAMGKTRKVYEHINLEELMESKGLDWFFPPEVI